MITGSLKLSNLLPLLNRIVLAIIPEINTLLNRDNKNNYADVMSITRN